MRKKIYLKKVAAIGTAVALSCSMAGCKANTEDETSKNTKQDDSEEELLNAMNSVTGIENSDNDADKEETVYVIADNSGKPSQIIVSEWLKNNGSNGTIKDTTNLTEITNVKGDEGYSTTSNGIEWENKGEDIYYQGKSNEALPISVNVTYYLDGQKISADKLAGKSGKIKIRYDYKNNSSMSMDVNGNKEEIYTPFVMATGIILPTDTFKNVTVSNGDVISEGNNMIAVGVGMPGFSDNLGVDDMENLDLDIEIPDYFEITADVTDFNLGMSMTICSNTLLDLSSVDTSGLDDVNDDIDELDDATKQLIDGSSQLAEGTDTLKDGTSSLSDGVNKLSDGVNTYTNGVASLKDGSQQIEEGTATLDDGAKSLSDNLLTAKNGAYELKDGLLSAVTGAQTLENKLNDAKSGSQQIKTGLDDLNKSAPKLVEGIKSAQTGASKIIAGYEGDGTEANPGAVAGAKAVASGLDELNKQLAGFNLPDMSSQQASLTDEQKQEIATTITNYLTLTEEGKAVVSASTSSFKQNVNSLLAAQGVTLDAQTQGVLDAVMEGVFTQAFTNIYISAYESGMEKGMEEVLTQVSDTMGSYAPVIAQMKGAVSQLATGSAVVADGVGQLYDGTRELSEGLDTMYDSAKSLPEGVNKLYDGTTSLDDGIGQLKDGAGSLAGGATQLYSGSDKLSSGISQLYDGSISLKDGTSSLRAGAATLNAGAGKLNFATKDILKGFTDLKSGVKELDDGAKQLQSGSLELKDGMIKFNDEGISKIKSLVKDDLNGITDRVEAITDVNDEYELYGGISEGKTGKEKFIIRIDGIEK